jgi:hypothetical protein
VSCQCIPESDIISINIPENTLLSKSLDYNDQLTCASFQIVAFSPLGIKSPRQCFDITKPKKGERSFLLSPKEKDGTG